MKKIILSFVLFVLSYCALYAVPAYPGTVKYRQPDGSVVNIRIHGDEYYHYTTLNGQVVSLDKDGFYKPSAKPRRSVASIEKMRKANRNVIRRTDGSEDWISMGNKRFLVMLIEFSDMPFTVPEPQTAFSNMLNQVGYSDNHATGSVFDYYYENSTHQFLPTYDVIGPITLSKPYAEYGGNDDNGHDKNANSALKEACKIANEQGLVDFSNYDNDKDGIVDNIFFFYAGHNEAEGGGEDTIWPHASGFGGVKYNGVYVGYSYACTSEYRGSTGSSMAGIGTFCHEFGHVLGLPDFYDVDYEDNGSAPAVYHFSLMCSGSYNNSGRTPPYLGAMERWMLGWMEVLEWNTSGTKVLRPVYENDGYLTITSKENEFFLYEARDGSGWDKYILAKTTQSPPKGMLVYHVDYSDNEVEGMTAEQLWGSNSINSYAIHPCYYLVSPKVGYSDYNDFLYPGTTGTTSFEGVDWSGVSSGFVLSDIAYHDGSVSLNLSAPDTKRLSGIVTDSKGKALAGVKVSLLPKASSGAQSLRRGKRFVSQKALEAAAGYSAVTDAFGKYCVDMPTDAGEKFEATFSLELYNSATADVSISGYRAVLDMILYNYSEGAPATLKKYRGISRYGIGFASDAGTYSATLAVMFTPEELSRLVGYELKTINFQYNGVTPAQVDVFVDFNAERVFTRKVENVANSSMTSVDIADAGLVIPSGKNVYIGYAVKDTPTKYWMAVDSSDPVDGGGMIREGYCVDGAFEWQGVGYNWIISADAKQVVSPFNQLGIKLISNPGEGKYAVGSTFTLGFSNPGVGDTPESTSWYFDGSPVSGSSVTLSTAGKHVIKAVLSYSDGSTEEIVQEIEVQ